MSAIVFTSGYAHAATDPAPSASSCIADSGGGLVRLSDEDEQSGHAVLLVHGWLSTSLDSVRTSLVSSPFSRDVVWADGSGAPASDTRSLETRLDDLPDTTVYAFDYARSASTWVGDSTVTTHLSEAIECLAADTGERVDIVAHSMGGLALRAALGADPALSSDVGEVVTVGTPNLGSDGPTIVEAMAVASGNLLSVVSPVAMAALPALTSECNRSLERDARSGCDIMPWLRTAFATAGNGGKALRTGSPEITALAPWPDTVHVLSIAGDSSVRLRVGEPLAFAGPLDAGLRAMGVDVPSLVDETLDFGDGLVAEPSALHGANRTFVTQCRTTIDASSLFGLRDTVTELARDGAIDPMSGPCAHDVLFENLDVVDHIVAAVSGTGPAGVRGR